MSVVKLSGGKHTWSELQFQEEEIVGGFCRSSERAASPSNQHMEQEKRIRREIANSNERRRMQSINAGFQSLRTLLPHHEGEKLSKAAILQQTAEYIYQLEQEKTSLLSQNCQLKRLVNQHEGQQEATAAASIKRRKLEALPSVVVPLTTAVSTESPDEGIGSMSPEPVTIMNNPVVPVDEPSKEMLELRNQLDRERRQRLKLEEQVRVLESQLYPERIREMTQQLQLHYRQDRRPSDVMILPDQLPPMQVVTSIRVPPVAQTVLLPAASPPVAAAIIKRSPSPVPPSPVPSPAPICPPTPPPPPPPPVEQRLPSALEAAIKAEPKVEVERLPSPGPEDTSPQARLYLASTSRQNLETIVEAIRHLEGDHLFSDEPNPHLHAPMITPPPTQDVPLALTTQSRHSQFLSFRQSTVAALQQQRPGVIVVKQHT